MDKSLVWRPQERTFNLAKSYGGDRLKKYIRNSSSAFIKKPQVRSHVFKIFGKKCVKCGSKKDLQIDHIKSVYSATLENIYFINSITNLQVLCLKCNTSKSP